MVVVVECAYCGDETERWQSEVERTENIYCSRECSTKAQTDGDPDKRYFCDNCGAEIDRSPSQIGRYEGGGTYCSVNCFEAEAGDKSNPTDVECAGCGEVFTIPEARVGFDNFCSDDCREEHGLECPDCAAAGFKSKQGVKMHYTRIHDSRYDVARLEDKYGVPVPWLLRTLHWTLGMPIYKIAERLDIGRGWVKNRLRENGDGHRTTAGYKSSSDTPIRPSDGPAPAPLINAVRHSFSEISWSRQSKSIRAKSDGCALCGASGLGTELKAHHIIPIRYGGTNEEWNLLPVCQSCHANIEGYTAEILESVL